MKTIIGVILFCIVIITTGVVIDNKRTRLAEEAAVKPGYICIQDDLYQINQNIKIVERERNPLDFETGQYYIIIHYRDGSKKTIYFKNAVERDLNYNKIKGILW